jgi:hypothetical protein
VFPPTSELTTILCVFTLLRMRKGTSKAPKFRLLGCEARAQEIRNRMPVQCGHSLVTATPLLYVKVLIEQQDGKQAAGLTADCLPPLWFDKDPEKDYRRIVADQLVAFRMARNVYVILGEKHQAASDLWHEAYPRILKEGAISGLNALTASFGSSFLERAIIDALCRLREVSFFEALKQDLLGMETSKILPPKPLDTLSCRHTLGLADPLTVGEISEAARLNDGLPQALEEAIESYGLRHFKVMVSGDHELDLERLSRVAGLINQRCRSGYTITLDGNEQFKDLAAMERLIEALRSKPYGNEFLDAVQYIKQPLHRDAALEPAAAPGVERLGQLKPVIIDESDDRLGAFEKAVGLGYVGTSHKNCKGIFKTLHNRTLITELNQKQGKKPEKTYFQIGEDLACVPILSLQQDLASLAALGIEHGERSGHHYYRGLDHLPPEETASALAVHRDLYEEREGSVFLRIQDGTLLLESIEAPGYGYQCEIAFEARTPLDEWSFDRLET